MRKTRKINNQPKTPQDMLNSVRYIDSVNGCRIVFKIYHTIKRDCRIFEIRERTGFTEPKRMTAVEVPL